MLLIPSINAESFEEVKEKIKMVEPYVLWAHLDISDGTFGKSLTWHNPKDLLNFETKLNLEAHLMVNEVEKKIDQWIDSPVKRFYFHIGATSNPEIVIEKIKAEGKEVGIAISPEESVFNALSFKDRVDVYQILGVPPGPAGQKMREETFKRIKKVKKNCKSCIIEVDGGINKKTAKKVKEAGADIIVSATAIFSDPEGVEEAIKNLMSDD